MTKVNSDLEVRVQGRDELTPALNQIESRLIRFVGAIGAGMAALRIGAAPVAAAVELERELANVRKTTNFTTTEMEQLNREILRLSTTVDVSAKDLAKIAAAAGQQGLGREGVAGVTAFTESVARMSSVLDITAEDAADGVGKIVNVFKIPLKEIERAISTFNEVSNNSTAKGAELLDVVKRIGDAAGNLNLQQSISLAATGLDFGQSPEVVGTAFAKVFSSLNQKAADFGRLLYGSTSDATNKWLADLEVNGLDAFKKVLSSLRELNPVDQQNTIIKLFGGGRIGALLNKLVQDSANVVLDRNFESATRGDQGFSAIQEQATVLNTVQAQAKITLNTLAKAGIEASEQLLGPLISYLRRLQDGLNSNEFRSFLAAVGKAVGQTLDLIDRMISAVSSLGIVWSNFIPLIQAFLGFKLAEVLGGMTARFLGLGSSLKSISKDAKEAAAGMEAAGVAASKKFTSGWFADKLGYRELYDEIVRTGKAKKDQIALDAQVAESAKKAAAARLNAQVAAAAEAPAAKGLRTAGLDLQSAKNQTQAQLQRAVDALFSIEQQKASRLAELTSQSEARRATIEQQFQARRQQIAATGSRVGLTQAKRDRDAAIAEEEASFQRRIRGVEAYWARRAATEAAGARAAVEAAQAAQAAAQARYDSANQKFTSVVNTSNAASANAASAATTVSNAQKASVALQATNVQIAAQGGALGILSVAWARMGLIWRAATGVLSTLASALGFLGRVALGAFGWITLVYTLADALGILRPLTEAFKGLAERLGLVSKARAQEAIQAEAKIKQLREEEQAALDATKAYGDLARGRTSAEVKNTLENLAQTAANPNLPDSERQRAQEELQKDGKAIQAALAENQQVLAQQTKKASDDAATAMAAASRNVEAAIQRLERYQELVSKRVGDSGRSLTLNEDRTLTGLSAGVDAAQKAYEAARKEAEKLAARQKDVQLNYERVQQDAKAFNAVVQSQFTPQSAALFEKYVSRYAELQDVIKRARDDAQEQSQKKVGQDKVEQANLDARILAQKELANEAAGASERIRKAFDNELKGLLASPGQSENALNALKALKSYFDKNISSVPSFLAALKDADPANLTGKNAPKAAPATSGDTSFAPKVTGQESLARRLRRAELEIQKANNAAIANLEQEGFNQRQRIADSAYERGLQSISKYYSGRQKLQLAAIDSEIKQRSADAQAVRFEQDRPGADAAEKKRYEAELVRINGDIALLTKRKQGIQDDTERDITRARQAFEDATISEQAKLSQEGIIPSGTVATFARTLDSLRAVQRDRLARMRTEGEEELAKSTDAGLTAEAAEAAITATGNKIAGLINRMNQAKAVIEEQRRAGELSTQEAEQRIDQSIEKTTPVLTDLVGEMQAFLDSIDDVKVRGSDAFKNLQDQVNGFRTNILSLNNELRNTAQTINRDVANQFADVIVKMRGGIDGIRQGLSDLASVVGNQILSRATQSISDELFTVIGGAGGKGGIGGAITDALGLGQKADGSQSNPFYTKEAKDGESVTDAIAESAQSNGLSLENLGSSIGNFFRNSDNQFVQWIGQLFSLLSASFASLITAIFTSSSSEGASDAFSSVVGAVAHTGGIIGSPYLERRMVSPAVFAGAARYHTGGVLGLKPNEVPIVGLKGEEMLTEDDPRHRNNLTGEGANKGGGKVVNVWVVTPDQQSDIGPGDIVAVVSDNISRGGSIKKLIQQVQIGK